MHQSSARKKYRLIFWILIALAVGFLWAYQQKAAVKPPMASALPDLIRVESPAPNAVVKSPFVVRGEARGLWFFEGSFPVQLFNDRGLPIATAISTAQGEWMTEEFVPFVATVEFWTDAEKGRLVLMKDNPSGLPEHAAQIEIPVRFR